MTIGSETETLELLFSTSIRKLLHWRMNNRLSCQYSNSLNDIIYLIFTLTLNGYAARSTEYVTWKDRYFPEGSLKLTHGRVREIRGKLQISNGVRKRTRFNRLSEFEKSPH